ncbi:TrmH family RNA methyltransferase [Helicobacter ailurogastricus]|uniref:TrmH family RNA methyltransferase n=1 Tax=Helicobacter ailurogastricus TaxID=1578720 RepID=UPI0022BD4EEC|nr:TrmH family RNA methyltransferase [Helicobacter ailurogastricus]GLH58618.1 23S rRNA methyltransferase NshR [Helicobacter ailurogastricus]GLH60151.1 23S rRNA methyltransferase NshR [Helicobacter ailurogastricus]GMB90550.1 23S rRNA methyltransferase NshR [Helicobacter ailurogastricus]
MVVFGKQVVLHMLKNHPNTLQEIYLAKDIDPKTFSLFKAIKSPIVRLDFKKAQAMAKGGNHQGFLAKVIPPVLSDLATLKTYDRLLVLCGLSDVGNVGALFRSVAALGFEGVVIDRPLPYEGLVRASLGALYGVPFCVCPHLLDAICELKGAGVVCYGAHLKGEDVRRVAFAPRLAVFLGAEGEGLASRIVKKMDGLLHICMQQATDSLNVSVAGAIIMDRARK